MITAKLEDGPMKGTTLEVPIVEGRPPKTLEVDGPGGVVNRYCLEEWEQAGSTAAYTFLYEV